MTGVEPRISGVGSDCCTNSAKTTAQGKNLTVKNNSEGYEIHITATHELGLLWLN